MIYWTTCIKGKYKTQDEAIETVTKHLEEKFPGVVYSWKKSEWGATCEAKVSNAEIKYHDSDPWVLQVEFFRVA